LEENYHNYNEEVQKMSLKIDMKKLNEKNVTIEKDGGKKREFTWYVI
jgi:hypothetical protein